MFTSPQNPDDSSYTPLTPPPTPEPPQPPKTSTSPVTVVTKRGFFHYLGIICFIAFILGLFGFGSLFYFSLQAISNSNFEEILTPNSSDELDAVVLEEGDDDVIAVLDIKGVITQEGTPREMVTASNIKQTLQLLKESDPSNVKAIILDMDTPGGEVIASDEIRTALLEFKNEFKIPIITCMHSMGASGGYYIATASDYIIANRMTMTGSIGVIMSTLNITNLMGKIGVTPETYCSGKMKDMLSPTRPRTPEEIAYVNKMVQDTFTEFATVVSEGRKSFYPDPETVKAASFADGRVLSGVDALKLHLVDQLGGMKEAVAKARELGKIEGKPTLLHVKCKSNLFTDLFELKNSLPLLGSKLLPIRTASLDAGKLYFIAPEAIGK